MASGAVPEVAPYGTWRSPISAERLVERAVRLADVEVHGGHVVWLEGRPQEDGRYVVVEDGVDRTPAGFSTRTQVHEYGGRCFAFAGEDLIASNWEDQRLWRFPPAASAEPVPITPEPEGPRAVRFADPVLTPDRRWLICVRERHPLSEGRTAAGVINDLVAVPLDAPVGAAQPMVVAEGHDFYSSPAISPDGSRLAWLCWDHPQMPWDATELWTATLDATDDAMRLRDAKRVAGVERAAGIEPGTGVDGESVQQPRFSPAGVLHWISDRSGWWNLYREGESHRESEPHRESGPHRSGEPAQALCVMDAEFSEPPWVFGLHTYAFLADGTLVATWHGPEGSGIGVVEDGHVDQLASAWTGFSYLAATTSGVAAIAASASAFPAVVRINLDGSSEVLRRSREFAARPGDVSIPEHLEFPTAGSETAFAYLHRPANSGYVAGEDERPPLIVMTHGGPTSRVSDSLSLEVQYWTTRGFAVANVNYRGSSGYGREYRNRLRGNWGVCDLEDVVALAHHLAAEGIVDPRRCVIRGGSAGGYTTLAALAFADTFAAGASYFGVADLGALARETHKFESRYLDRLVGRWPQDEATYNARSPICHTDGFNEPLLILQGLEDRIVLPAQSQMIHDALKRKGVPVAYIAFEGEQHGFRRADTIVRATSSELSFYGVVLGFEPDGAIPVPIENL